MKNSLFKITHPSSKYVYAVTTGTYAGEMLIYIEEKDNNYYFLSIPKMENREVPVDKFKQGLELKIVDILQEKLSSRIYSVCVKQYQKNNKNCK